MNEYKEIALDALNLVEQQNDTINDQRQEIASHSLELDMVRTRCEALEKDNRSLEGECMELIERCRKLEIEKSRLILKCWETDLLDSQTCK